MFLAWFKNPWFVAFQSRAMSNIANMKSRSVNQHKSGKDIPRGNRASKVNKSMLRPRSLKSPMCRHDLICNDSIWQQRFNSASFLTIDESMRTHVSCLIQRSARKKNLLLKSFYYTFTLRFDFKIYQPNSKCGKFGLQRMLLLLARKLHTWIACF